MQYVEFCTGGQGCLCGPSVVEYRGKVAKAMTFNYTPKGVCAGMFQISVEDGTVQSVQVMGGCSGNLQGISALLKGMKVEEAIQRMEGIRCGMKATSCPDQLAQALKTVQ